MSNTRFDLSGDTVAKRPYGRRPWTVEVPVSDHAEIIELLAEMSATGTFRSRIADTTTDQQKHWLVGIGAQLAVAQFLADRHDGLQSVQIDTRAYDEAQSDDGDLHEYVTADGASHICDSCEVKKTASYAKHVAITETEVSLIGPDEPVVYATTSWDGDAHLDWHDGLPDPATVRASDGTITYEVQGFCYLDDLSWTEQGAKPWTQAERNLCEPFTQLRTDWDEFVASVCPEAVQ